MTNTTTQHNHTPGPWLYTKVDFSGVNIDEFFKEHQLIVHTTGDLLAIGSVSVKLMYTSHQTQYDNFKKYIDEYRQAGKYGLMLYDPETEGFTFTQYRSNCNTLSNVVDILRSMVLQNKAPKNYVPILVEFE